MPCLISKLKILLLLLSTLICGCSFDYNYDAVYSPKLSKVISGQEIETPDILRIEGTKNIMLTISTPLTEEEVEEIVLSDKRKETYLKLYFLTKNNLTKVDGGWFFDMVNRYDCKNNNILGQVASNFFFTEDKVNEESQEKYINYSYIRINKLIQDKSDVCLDFISPGYDFPLGSKSIASSIIKINREELKRMYEEYLERNNPN